VESLKKHILATRVGHYVNDSVKILTKGLDISVSEYLRKLILHDLDSRQIFQNELEKNIIQLENPPKVKANAK
jgi:hypothetical protein